MTEDGLRLLIEAIVMISAVVVIGGAGYFVVAQARRKAPATWQQMEDRYDRQQKRLDDALHRLDEAWQRIDQLETEMDDLRDERDSDHELMQAWIAYARKTTTRLKELTGEEPPPEPSAITRRRTGRAALTRFIEERFNVEEIDGLAFDLGVAADQLAGDTRSARSRALVQWAADRGRLAELRRRAEEARPYHL